MTSAQLALFGAFHFDDPDAVAADLAAVASDADAVAIELPDDSADRGDALHVWLRVPLVCIGFAALGLFVQVPFMLALNRDPVATELVALRRVTADRGLPVHRVDEPSERWMQAAGWPWIVLSWLVVVAALVLAPAATLLTTGILVLGSVPLAFRINDRVGRGTAVAGVAAAYLVVAVVALAGLFLWPLVLAGFLTAIFCVKRFVDRRNEYMLDRVAEIAEADGHDRVVLVTGAAHLASMVEFLTERGLPPAAVYVPRWLSHGRLVTDLDGRTLPSTGDLTTDEPVLDPEDLTPAFGRRVLALGVDLVVFGLLGAVLGMLVVDAMSMVGAGLPHLAGAVLGAVVLEVVGPLVAEETYSRTPGKLAVGLVVADADTGQRIDRRAAVVRHMARLIDGWFCYGLGGFVALLADRRQRLGDFLAGTVVGRVDPPDGGPVASPWPAVDSVDGRGERSDVAPPHDGHRSPTAGSATAEGPQADAGADETAAPTASDESSASPASRDEGSPPSAAAADGESPEASPSSDGKSPAPSATGDDGSEEASKTDDLPDAWR